MKNKCNIPLSEYLKKLDIMFEELKILSNDSIKGIAMKWYSSEWKEELKERAVLKYTEYVNKKSKKKDSMIIEIHQDTFLKQGVIRCR